MPVGIIQFFMKSKGFGYVRVPETREEFHVRRKNLLTPVQKGDRVRFEIKENKRGMYAAQVRKITSSRFTSDS